MKRVYWLIIITLLFFACNRTAEKAADYNDKIINLQRQVIEDVNEMDSTLVDYNSEEMEIAHLELKTEIRKSLQNLKSVGAFRNDSSLYIAAEDLFLFYKKISDNQYQQLIEIMETPDSLYTLEDQQRALAIEDTIRDAFDQHHEEFASAQQKFSEKYRLTIEND